MDGSHKTQTASISANIVVMKPFSWLENKKKMFHMFTNHNSFLYYCIKHHTNKDK